MKRIFISPPHTSGLEQEYIQEAFKANFIAPLGPQVDQFESELSQLTGIKHCLALNSGTAAIHLALHSLEIGPGDLVLASILTFIGGISPIKFLGATPVFIDSDSSTWNMDPDLLAEEIESLNKHGNLPKAVLVTDLYGQCADYDRIREVCEPFGIPIITDSAEAVGATYKGIHSGKGAEAAIYSFNGNKIITTSGGGMLASDDKDLIDFARFLSQQARDPAPHYEHTQIGYNYRMSNILAAIGLGQLDVLEKRVEKKREIFDFYYEALSELPGIEFMPEADYGRSNRWLTVILIDPDRFGSDREKIRLALEEEDIESRPIWKPMHLQPVFRVEGDKAEGRRLKDGKKRYPCRVVGGEVAEDLFDRGLCLPSGTAMTNSDLDRVIEVILKCHRG